MDPDTCLKELLAYAAEIIREIDKGEAIDDVRLGGLGAELAEHIQNLDEWITKGGFMPRRWSQDGKR